MEALKGLYHPDKLDEQSFIDNFTIRLKEYHQIIDNLLQQKQKPLQHYLITGKRGMGKSTLLRRIYIEATREPLNKKMFAVRLGSEQYKLSRLYKLWEQVIENLGRQEPAVMQQKAAIENSKSYEEGLVHIVADYLQEKQKTLLLLIDNFDQFIEKIPVKDKHALREALMIYPIQIIGNTVFYNEQFYGYNNPFFDFFKPIALGNLDKQEAEEFIKLRAEGEGIVNFEEIFEKQKGKINTLRILSGGVPRTLLILLGIVLKKNTGDAVEYLQEMLEQVTPLYQDRMKSLSPQQQEIMHHLAMHWDRTPVKELAAEMRIPSKSISAQLLQLENSGYINKIDTGGRNNFYEIDERFFNIWLLMSEASPYDTRRVIWLTKWLDAFYSTEELEEFAAFCHNGLKQAKPASRFLLAQALSESQKLDEGYKKKLVSETAKELEDKISDVRVWAESYDKKLYEKENKIKEEISSLIEEGDYKKAIEKTDELLKANEPLGLFAKGYTYYKQGDIDASEKYYLRAVEKGNIDAINNLATVYKNQRKNVEMAEKYYLQAVENGSVNAMYNLALLYEEGKKDIDKAEKYYLQAVKNGHIEAMYNLGLLYEDNRNDLDKAEKYYLLAVEKGHSNAMYNLALLYEDNRNDLNKAEKYYLLAAEKGHVDSMYNLALLYENARKDIDKAEKYYLLAVEKRHAIAMNNLALLYINERKDIDKAEKYYLQAVENGSVNAMYNLALLYAEEKKDIDKAEKHYLQAVENGDADAMYNLALLYINERKDIDKAKKYYSLAAEIGNTLAMGNLASLYYSDNAVSKKEQALELARKAVDAEKTQNPINLAIYIIALLWNEKVTDAYNTLVEFLNRPQSTDEDLSLTSDMLGYFLIFKQKNILNKIFNQNEQWVDKYKPVYYALMHEMKDEYPKEYLKMTEELQEPVQEILDFVRSEQTRLGLN